MKSSTLEAAIPPAKHFPAPEAATSRIRAVQVHAASVITRGVLMILGPAAVCGISVGAMAVILTQADPALHRTLVSVVWTAAVLISSVIVGGILMLGKQAESRDW